MCVTTCREEALKRDREREIHKKREFEEKERERIQRQARYDEAVTNYQILLKEKIKTPEVGVVYLRPRHPHAHPHPTHTHTHIPSLPSSSSPSADQMGKGAHTVGTRPALPDAGSKFRCEGNDIPRLYPQHDRGADVTFREVASRTR